MLECGIIKSVVLYSGGGGGGGGVKFVKFVLCGRFFEGDTIGSSGFC